MGVATKELLFRENQKDLSIYRVIYKRKHKKLYNIRRKRAMSLLQNVTMTPGYIYQNLMQCSSSNFLALSLC